MPKHWKWAVFVALPVVLQWCLYALLYIVPSIAFAVGFVWFCTKIGLDPVIGMFILFFVVWSVYLLNDFVRFMFQEYQREGERPQGPFSSKEGKK